jgi:LysM repeat protein
MDIDSNEPPSTNQKADRSKGYNKKLQISTKPVPHGFKQFDAENTIALLESFLENAIVAVDGIREITAKYIFLFEKWSSDFARKSGISRSFLYQTILLLFIVFLPWISEAAMGQQQQAELKALSQSIDPIKEGQIAMNINQYLPAELYADPDTVVLNRMTETDNSYTLQQQLALNAGNNAGPERLAPTYELKQGETITQIADRFNLHVGTILAANNLQPTDLKRVKPGTILNIPSSDTDTSDNWLVALNKAEADAKAAAAVQAAAKKAAAAKKVASARTTTGTTTVRAGTYSSDITVIGISYEQCLPWARAQTGIQIHGYAGNVAATQSDPRVGGIALDKFFGHASVVVGVGDGYIIVHEANYVRGKITERRVSTAAIRGYVY